MLIVGNVRMKLEDVVPTSTKTVGVSKGLKLELMAAPPQCCSLSSLWHFWEKLSLAQFAY